MAARSSTGYHREMSRTSHWMLERNRDLAATMFGEFRATETADDRYERCLDDEWQAKKLTPLIVGGATVAVFGGMVGLTPKQRAMAATLAVAFFFGI